MVAGAGEHRSTEVGEQRRAVQAATRGCRVQSLLTWKRLHTCLHAFRRHWSDVLQKRK